MSGITRTKDLPISEEQVERWKNGEHIQNAMPHLSEADREFIISGIDGDEWDELFGEPEDEEEQERMSKSWSSGSGFFDPM